MSLINKYLKKDIYLTKKDIKLFMILDQYASTILEYQKITNLLDNTSNLPSKFRSKNLVKINDDARGAYNKDSQIKSKTSMLKSSYVTIVMHIYF